jgi:hypothetical protein
LKLEEVLPNNELNELYEVQQMLAERVDAWIQCGVDKGMQQGIEKKALGDAQAMLDEGCNLAFIAKITKLSLETIQTLQQKNK